MYTENIFKISGTLIHFFRAKTEANSYSIGSLPCGVEEDELDVVHGGRAQQREEQHAVVLCGFGAAVIAVLAAAADSRPSAELD